MIDIQSLLVLMPACMAQDLEAALANLRLGSTQEQRLLTFICGPPGMTEAVNRCLQGLGMHADDIRFEKWW